MTEEQAFDLCYPELERRLEKNVNFMMGLVLKHEPRCNPIALRRVLARKVRSDILESLNG